MSRTLGSYGGLPSWNHAMFQLRSVNTQQMSILRRLHLDAGSYVDGPIDYITRKVLHNDFSIRMFRSGGGNGKGTEVLSREVDPHQYSEWLTAVRQILRHAMIYGFAVLHYVPVPTADGRALRLMPRVLDPVTECWVRFNHDPTEQRRYFAFARASQHLTFESMPNTRVLMFSEPDSLGSPISPLSRVQIVLGYLVRALARVEFRDIRRTNPPLIFEQGTWGRGSANPTAATIARSMEVSVGQPTDFLRGAAGTATFEAIPNAAEQNQALMLALRQQELYDDFIREQYHAKQIPDEYNEATQLRLYDPQLQSYVVQPMPSPYKPAKLLPFGVALSSQIPTPSTGPELIPLMEQWQDQIALAFGVPANFFRIPAQYTATHVELTQDTVADTVEMYQRMLELAFIDIFFDLYAASFEQQLGTELDKQRQPQPQPQPATPAESSDIDDDDLEENDETEKANERETLISQLKEQFSFEASFPRNVWANFTELTAMHHEGILPFEDYVRTALQNSNIEITGTPTPPDNTQQQPRKKQKKSNSDD